MNKNYKISGDKSSNKVRISSNKIWGDATINTANHKA